MPAPWPATLDGPPAPPRSSFRHGLAGGPDHRQHRPGLDRLTFGHDDSQQHAAGRRGDLGVDLVGIHLEQRLELVDRLPFDLEPLRDGAFDDRFAQLRHDDLGRHLVSPSQWPVVGVGGGTDSAERSSISLPPHSPFPTLPRRSRSFASSKASQLGARASRISAGGWGLPQSPPAGLSSATLRHDTAVACPGSEPLTGREPLGRRFLRQ